MMLKNTSKVVNQFPRFLSYLSHEAEVLQTLFVKQRNIFMIHCKPY